MAAGYDPKRKRYYLVREDILRNPSDYELLNEREVFPQAGPLLDGSFASITAGTREHPVPWQAHPVRYGLPRLLARPMLRVALRNRPLDSYGFHRALYISSRAKRLLSEIDPDAFEFAECETISRASVKVEPYWRVAILRPVDDFDEVRSVFVRSRDLHPQDDGARESPNFAKMLDIHMSPGFPHDWHAFFFTRYGLAMVFDDVLADAWRAQGLSGLSFDPLQPPTPKERRLVPYGDNLAYWRRVMREDESA